MDVRNCKSCGRLINYMGGAPLCTSCQKKLEEKFQEVKEYLNENPNSSIHKVAEEVDVSVKQIKQWVREERLTFSEDSVQGIDCENCGRMIRTGRFCESCKQSLASTLRSALDTPKSFDVQHRNGKDKDRMRFLK